MQTYKRYFKLISAVIMNLNLLVWPRGCLCLNIGLDGLMNVLVKDGVLTPRREAVGKQTLKLRFVRLHRGIPPGYPSSATPSSQ